MNGSRKMGAVDVYIWRETNSELKLETLGDQGLDSIEWLECMDLNTEEAGRSHHIREKWKWLQLLKDFNCAVTSTWSNTHNHGEFHTRRGWGSRVRKKQIDYNVTLAIFSV